MEKFGKKGQVTVFLIIGVLLLAGFATVSYLNADKTVKKIDVTVPPELLPVKNYISSCVDTIATEAIVRIGKNGGYIGLNDEDKKYTETSFKINENFAPTEQDGIVFFKGFDWKIPYWQYFESSNTCKEKCSCSSKKPDLYDTQNSIQKQIERYIDANLKTCIKLDQIKGYDKLTGAKEYKSQVIIGERDVSIILDYPIEAQKGEKTIKNQYFDTQIPVRLKRMYEIADDLAKKEKNFTYLERQGMAVLSSFAKLDENALPPFADSELDPSGSGMMWIKSEVAAKVQNLFSIYVPALMLADSANFVERENLRYAAFILPNKFPDYDISASFTYLNTWPLYFNIKGRGVEGEMIGPESMGSSFFQFIGLRRYNYYYDVSYPVLVRLHDKNSFKGKGFDFYFALESNIRSNKPINCSGPLKETPSALIGGNLLCKSNQYCSNVTVNVTDGYTGKQINDAKLTYTCVSTSCPVDRINPFNKTSIKYVVPQCFNAKLSASKDGYSSSYTTGSFFCNQNYEKPIKIYPSVELNVTVKKKKLTKGNFGWEMQEQNEESLYTNEKAIIVLDRVKESDFDEDFSATTVLQGPEKGRTMSLIPGKYTGSIIILYELPDQFGNEKIVIPAEHVHEDGGLLGKDVDYDLEEIVFNKTFLVGMTVFKDMTTPIEFTVDNLKGRKSIKFLAIAMGDLDNLNHADMEVMGRFENITAIERERLEPVLS